MENGEEAMQEQRTSQNKADLIKGGLISEGTGTPLLTLFFETLKNRVSRKPCC